MAAYLDNFLHFVYKFLAYSLIFWMIFCDFFVMMICMILLMIFCLDVLDLDIFQNRFNSDIFKNFPTLLLVMDFFIDGQICARQHEAALLTLIISHKLTPSL